MLQRSIEVEGVARHCIERFLSQKSLWEHFQADDRLSEFWTLSEDSRRSLWGEPLDFEKLRRGFDPNSRRDEELGLH